MEDSSRNPPICSALRLGGTPMSETPANPVALTVEQLAAMLGVATAKLEEHIAAGAPTGGDGTVNLVHYVAWLSRRLSRPDDDEGTDTDGD